LVQISFTSDSTNPQWVELFNADDTSVDLGGWALTYSINKADNKGMSFVFGEDFVMRPGQFVRITNYTLGFLIKDGITLFRSTCCDPNGGRYLALLFSLVIFTLKFFFSITVFTFSFFTGDFDEFEPEALAFDKRKRALLDDEDIVMF
jgi:hypothetical protein